MLYRTLIKRGYKKVFKKKISAVKILALFNGTIFIHNVVLTKRRFCFKNDNGQNDSEVEVENFDDDADFSPDREFPEMETE